MHVTINSENLAADFSHLGNLEEVLAEIHERFIPPGEQLFQVHVNGEFFSESYPRESRYLDLKEVLRLEVKTVTDEEMARIILRDAAGQGKILAQAIEKSATLFRVAAEDEANHYFAQVLEALRWLLQTGDHACQVLKVDWEKVHAAGRAGVNQYFQELQGLLSEMQEMAEEEDYVMLADLMEYELLPLVREWQEILAKIAGC